MSQLTRLARPESENKMTSAIESMNDDVLLLIIEAVAKLPDEHLLIEPYLSSPLGNLSKTSKKIRTMCMPLLFRVVDLASQEADDRLKLERFSSLAKTKHVCHTIRAFSFPLLGLVFSTMVEEQSSWTSGIEWALGRLLLFTSLKELHLCGMEVEHATIDALFEKLDSTIPSVQTLHTDDYVRYRGIFKLFPKRVNTRINWRSRLLENLRAVYEGLNEHALDYHVEINSDWTVKDVDNLYNVMPDVSCLTMSGTLKFKLSELTNQLSRFRQLRHLAITDLQYDYPYFHRDADGIYCRRSMQQYQKASPRNEEPLEIKKLYFTACPKLETLCIHGLEFIGSIGKLVTRSNNDLISRSSLLPEHFIARRFANRDRSGRFLFGVPDAISERRYNQQYGFDWRRKQRRLAQERDWDENMPSEDDGTEYSDGDEEDDDTDEEEDQHEDEDEHKDEDEHEDAEEDEHEGEDDEEDGNNV